MNVNHESLVGMPEPLSLSMPTMCNHYPQKTGLCTCTPQTQLQLLTLVSEVISFQVNSASSLHFLWYLIPTVFYKQ